MLRIFLINEIQHFFSSLQFWWLFEWLKNIFHYQKRWIFSWQFLFFCGVLFTRFSYFFSSFWSWYKKFPRSSFYDFMCVSNIDNVNRMKLIIQLLCDLIFMEINHLFIFYSCKNHYFSLWYFFFALDILTSSFFCVCVWWGTQGEKFIHFFCLF